MDKCYIINDNHCEITIDNNLFDKEVVIQTTYKYNVDFVYNVGSRKLV